MSSLYKRGGVYQIQYVEGGKTIQRSLRTKYKAMAVEAQKEIDRRLGEATEARNKNQGVGSISDLRAAYLVYVQKRYCIDGEPTSTVRMFKHVSTVLNRYPTLPVSEFGPRKLTALIEHWIETGCSRETVNKYSAMIKAMFRWGVAAEMVEETTWRALMAVRGVEIGRDAILERDPVGPAPDASIEAVRDKVSSVIRAVIDLQLMTAARPAEILRLRPRDIDRTGNVWTANLTRHKTRHKGRTRILYFGPKAQTVLLPFLIRKPDTYLFSPRESLAEYYGRRSRHRPEGMPKEAPKTKRAVGSRYSTGTYYEAIQNACDAAEVPRWHPNQLRHNAATAIRAEYGLEAAQIILGHSTTKMTEIYAERDVQKALDIMRKIG